jgi:hypothetical protein
MFEHFTFSAEAQTQCHQQEDRSASPTDTSFLSPSSPLPPTTYFDYQPNLYEAGINDIVHKFSQQSLRPQDNEASQQPPLQQCTPSSPDLETTELDMIFCRANGDRYQILTPASMPFTPLLPPSHGKTLSCRRLQRQLNVQLQSCSSHMRDINMLVEDMIESNSQCTLHKSTSRPYLSSPPPSRAGPVTAADLDLTVDTTGSLEGREVDPNEDEGFAETEDDLWAIEEMTLRRASTPLGIRKYSQMWWRNGGDCVGQGPQVGRLTVRSAPRMRRRKAKRVAE